MPPASVNSRGTSMDGAEEDEEFCKQCLCRGERNALRYLQINDDVAVFVCDGEKCTSLPSLAPGTQLVIERRAADITYLRRRKRRATSLPSSNCQAPSSTQKATSVPARDQNSRDPEIQPRIGVSFPLPRNDVIQWPNEGNHCWLDVSMLLLVQFGSLRRCHQALGVSSLLKQLCDGFDEAQHLVANKVDSGQSGETQTVNKTRGDITSAPDGQQKDSSHDQFSFDFLDAVLQGSNQFANSKETASTINAIHHQLDRIHLSSSFSQTSANGNTDSTTHLAAAVDLLRKRRQELFDAIKPKLRCEEGKGDSPVTALPLILRLDGPAEEHFTTRYRREFYCYSCGFTNVTIHRNVVMSLTSTTSDFSMQAPTMHHPCPQCRSPGQISRIVYHSIPTCPLVHFSNGLVGSEGKLWLPRQFKHQGITYRLTCVVQYKREPDHFVIWITDPAREMWLECNDLSSPLCQWTSEELAIPPSEVHILGWEREDGHCKACVSLQEQMLEIEESPIPLDIAVATGGTRPSGTGVSNSVVPVRKDTHPVIAGRSPSPLTIAGDRLPNQEVAVRNASIAASTTSQSLPSTGSRTVAGLLSIGTPPHSPEFSKPAKTSPSDTVANGQSGSSLQETGVTWRNTKEEQLDLSSGRVPSSDFRDTIPYGIAKNFRNTNVSHGTQQNPKRTRGSVSGIIAEIPRQIMNWQQTKRDNPLPMPTSQESSQPNFQNFSVARMLRSLNSNPPQRFSRKREQVVVATLPAKGHPSTPPKRIKKLRLPKRKYDTFSAFQQNAGKFSGYMKKDHPATSEQCPGVSVSQRDREKDQEDQYQSSALLTPSSSVSSPSACSESSLQNENTCLLSGVEQLDGAAAENSSAQDLSHTMDALCRALEVTSEMVQPASSNQSPTFLDDYNFLEGLLR